MSFTAAARRAADRSLPLGARVTALCHALDAFAPFGFDKTRERLRAVTGVPVDGVFDEPRLDRALALLTEARASWAAYARRAAAESTAAKRADRTGRRPTEDELFLAWTLEYFGDPERAAVWGVVDLGDCRTCGHPLLHHAIGCRVCDCRRPIVPRPD